LKGTFITEWGEGELENEILFGNVSKYVNQLSLIAEHYHLDGWFINIESITFSGGKGLFLRQIKWC
jgi:hypothetical protein